MNKNNALSREQGFLLGLGRVDPATLYSDDCDGFSDRLGTARTEKDRV